jgi:hypothetical protein
MLLVTGADHTHGASLRQLLASVRRHEPGLHVIVYDLGLTFWQRWRIGRRRRLEWRRFDFERHPAYFDIRVNAGEFAWKPVIISDLLGETGEPVLWLDAGVVVKEPLTALRAAIGKCGFYSPRSAGTIPDWTHPKMLACLGVDADWARDKLNLAACCVAFDPSFAAARELARRWREGALIRDCIAPEGSDRSNHRQDQALLTVLAHLAGLAEASEPNLLGFQTHQDIDGSKNPTLRRVKRFLFPRGVPPALKGLRAFLRLGPG